MTAEGYAEVLERGQSSSDEDGRLVGEHLSVEIERSEERASLQDGQCSDVCQEIQTIQVEGLGEHKRERRGERMEEWKREEKRKGG